MFSWHTGVAHPTVTPVHPNWSVSTFIVLNYVYDLFLLFLTVLGLCCEASQAVGSTSYSLAVVPELPIAAASLVGAQALRLSSSGSPGSRAQLGRFTAGELACTRPVGSPQEQGSNPCLSRIGRQVLPQAPAKPSFKVS